MDRTPLANVHEDAFARWAEEQGWSVSKRGWPDFLCRRGGEIMAVEVKGGKDFVRPEQYAAIGALRTAGLPTFVWSPEKGLTEPARMELTESVVTLRARIAELERILADVLARSDPGPPSQKQEPLNFVDDEQFALKKLAPWCRRRHHPGHESTLNGHTMQTCVWLVLLSKKYDVERAAQILGLDLDDAREWLAKALAHQKTKIMQRKYGLSREAA